MECRCYVIQFDNGTYWAGYNSTTAQIRNARFYSSLKECKEWGAAAYSRITDRKSNLQDHGIRGYKIVAVQIQIVGDVL